MSIDILLATYNGEKYIASQIYSLLAQTHQDWILYVADDDSTDNTLAIICEIMKDDSRLKIINFDKPVRNAGKNFWRLLPFSTSEYIIFCDQDDIWLERKLELLLLKSQEWKNQHTPNLVFCDAYKYDQKTSKIIANTIYPYIFLNFEDFIFHNGGYQGCSILFNSVLRDKALKFDREFYIHDEIISLTAHTFGEVLYLNKPLMLYRLHETNVIGLSKNTNNLLENIRKIINGDSYIVFPPSKKTKESYYELFKLEMDEASKEIFNFYDKFCLVGYTTRVCMLFKHNLTKFRKYLILKTLLVSVFPSTRK